MKKYLILSLAVLSLLSTTESFAGGWHGGGYRGGYRGGYGFGFAPFVAGALIGGAVVGATYAQPVYYTNPVVVTPQPVYAQPPVAVPVQPHAFYCATSQNYYPTVPTCSVPWQQVN